MKRSPLRRKTPMKKTASTMARKPIRKVSVKMKKKNLIYSQRRKWFLAKADNARCPVAAAGLIRIFPEDKEPTPHHRATTEIHHMLGRVGPLLLDEDHWLAVSGAGHAWMHANPAKAREMGWLGK